MVWKVGKVLKIGVHSGLCSNTVSTEKISQTKVCVRQANMGKGGGGGGTLSP